MHQTKSSATAAGSGVVAPADWIMLHQLCAEHWARVDRVSDRPPHELYTEDGAMLIGSLDKRGHAAIAAYFVTRFAGEDESGRRTRHVTSGLLVEADGPDAAMLRSTVLVFSGTGPLPMASAPPSSIGDFTDRCVRSSDGSWRFARRYARILFTGAGAAPHVSQQ